MSKYNIELDDKELYLVWSIVCWFDTPVTAKLKYKLSGMCRSPLRDGLEKRYDRRIEDRIIAMGSSLQRMRDKERS